MNAQAADTALFSFTQAQQLQLLISAAGLVLALLVLHFVGRPLIRRSIRRFSRNPLLGVLQFQDARIAGWVERLIAVAFIASTALAVAGISGVDIAVATDGLKRVGASLVTWVGTNGLRVFLIVGLAYLANRALLQFVPLVVRSAMLRGKEGIELDEASKRAIALIQVGHYMVTSTVWILAGFMILSELGVTIAPMLAGVGIVGLALGFGAQNLVRDIIAGIFVLGEDQYRVGDVASVGGKTGLVEGVNLRRTLLRDLDGIVHIVPNGEISIASNYTKGYSRVNLDISVAYKEDLDRVIRVLNRVGSRLAQDDYYGALIIEPPRALRVNSFDNSGITLKVLGVTKPIRQWEVMGELRRRIKREFDQEGIEIPFPHQTIYWGVDSHPAATPQRTTAPRATTKDSDSDGQEERLVDPWAVVRDEREQEQKPEATTTAGTDLAGDDVREHMDQIREMRRTGAMGLFVDLDGTLAAIAPRPEAASITPSVRQSLTDIAARIPVTVLTGRSVSDAQRIIGLSSVTYAGNHGVEWLDKGTAYVDPQVERYVRQVHSLAGVLQQSLKNLSGVVMEDKGPSISIHYRLSPTQVEARERIFEAVAQAPESQGLRVREGKMVVEVRAPVDLDKGTALRWVVQDRKLRSALIIGDDLTDVDAFRALTQIKHETDFRGINVAVLGPNTPGEVLVAADYHLPSTEGVELFLTLLAEMVKRK
jgi:moderate conductance mechanosensitive channel